MITFPTERPQALLNAFNKAIKDGDVTTWEKDGDGDFTHLAAQWKSRAWLRPEVVAGVSLRFTILFSNKESEKRAVYSYYHAHMARTFVEHFYNEFSPEARVTPKPFGEDSKI